MQLSGVSEHPTVRGGRSPVAVPQRFSSAATVRYSASAMMYMVIERFKNREAKAIYERFRGHGRMMPDGLRYVGSWIETNFDRCFQVMECNDESLFGQWMAHWSDLMDFEIVPVMTSAEASSRALSSSGDPTKPRL